MRNRGVALQRTLRLRVARNLGVDVSYISRIARGERKSKVAEMAITREFYKAVAVMNGLPRSYKKPHVVVTLQCPRCKTRQHVHIAARTGFGRVSERISCLNCDHHFKLTIPDRIIRGPF